MSLRQGFLPVRNVNIAGGNIKVRFTPWMTSFVFSFVRFGISKSILTIVNYVIVNEENHGPF